MKPDQTFNTPAGKKVKMAICLLIILATILATE
jgi:hypothetical protein